MNTPIFDFVQQYAASNTTRFHMPGHKGQPLLGCEPWDITEVKGADALYEADGIIAQSEANTTALFGSKRTLYSTEGSSQCIRAMLYLAIMHYRDRMRILPSAIDTSDDTVAHNTSADHGNPHQLATNHRPVIVAARNVHKAFVYAAALLDLDVVWLWPEESDSLCGCPISAKQLEDTLSSLAMPPAAVYLTSPDYLGGMADIPTMAEICHRHDTLLLIDNAHGAYLRFLQPSQHPLNQGADLCCDSAHKTLPVLTGGAYLHIAGDISARMAHPHEAAASHLADHAKSAMALFGSTSPSYLTLASLDRCNALLAQDYPVHLAETTTQIRRLKEAVMSAGWTVEPSDPLRLTLRAPQNMTGVTLAEHLRSHQIECEYADESFLVLMFTPNNTPAEFDHLLRILGENHAPQKPSCHLPQINGESIISIRQALFSPHEIIPVENALGRICGAPTVSCPPAIPIVVSGEQVGEDAIQLFRHYGISQVDVVIS